MMFVALVTLIASISAADASLSVLYPPRLSGTTHESPAYTVFIGPQFGDDNIEPVEAELMMSVGSACDPQPPIVAGRAIVVRDDPAFGCSAEQKYLNLVSAEVAAILKIGIGMPGISAYQHDGERGAKTRAKLVPMVEISDDIGKSLLKALAKDETILIRLDTPDYNGWIDVFEGPVYMLFIRATCGGALLLNSLMAAVFLSQHIQNIHTKLVAKARDRPTSQRPAQTSKMIRNVFDRLGVPHAALAIECVSNLALGLYLCIAGLNSTPTLKFQLMMPFVTLLVGWSWMSTILATVFWHRNFRQLVPPTKSTSRVCKCTEKPACRRGLFAVLMAGPFLLDVGVGVLLSQYFNPATLGALSGLTFMTLQMVVSIFFFFQSYRYIKESKRVRNSRRLSTTMQRENKRGSTTSKRGSLTAKPATSEDSGEDPLDTFLRRLSRWTTRCAMCMMAVIFINPLAATREIWYPAGLSFFWSCLLTGRIGVSVCLVMAFKPASSIKKASNTADVGHASSRMTRTRTKTKEPLHHLGAGETTDDLDLDADVMISFHDEGSGEGGEVGLTFDIKPSEEC